MLKKRRPGSQRIRDHHRRRRLYHHADGYLAVVPVALGVEFCLESFDPPQRLFHLVEARHQREHHADVAVVRCPQDRSHLGPEKLRTSEGDAYRAPAEEGVLLRRHVELLAELVSADVHGSDRHRVVAEDLRQLAIDGVLLLFVGHVLARKEQELRSEQPDTVHRARQGPANLVEHLDVQFDAYAVPVQRDSRRLGLFKELADVLGQTGHPSTEFLDERVIGADEHLACVSVDEDHLTGLGRGRGTLASYDGRNPQRPRQNGGVARGTARVGYEPLRRLPTHARCVGRGKGMGNDDGFLLEAAEIHVGVAGELRQNAASDILDIQRSVAHVFACAEARDDVYDVLERREVGVLGVPALIPDDVDGLAGNVRVVEQHAV